METLSQADVGNPGWDPICFVTNEGFKYWMPALARLALEPETEQHAWYLPQLLLHLNDRGKPNNYRGKSNRYLNASLQQCNAVTQFLIHIKDTRPASIDDYGVREEIEDTINLWDNNSLRARG